jgi:DUF4097 and DUF4098 domain-containing protein YvlB
MSARKERFEVDGEAEIDIAMTSGEIVVTEGGPGAVEVFIDGAEDAVADTEIYESGGVVVVKAKSRRRWFSRPVDARITVPVGSRAALRTASGDVHVPVTLSEVDVSVTAGDVRIGDVSGPLRVRSAAGDVLVGTCAGVLQISSASGDVRVEDGGSEGTIESASGDVVVARASGTMAVRTAAGDVTIRHFDGQRLNGKSMSGDFRVGIPPGRELDVDIQTLSGEFRNQLPEAGGAEPAGRATIQIKTLSGDVVLRGVG